jgi:exonuclease III
MFTYTHLAALMAVLTVATLNINGLLAPTRVGMLNDFLRCHNIDILMAQEVTSTELLTLPGYTNVIMWRNDAWYCYCGQGQVPIR